MVGLHDIQDAKGMDGAAVSTSDDGTVVVVLKKLGAAVQALTWSHFNACVLLACLYCRARMNKSIQLDFCTFFYIFNRSDGN